MCSKSFFRRIFYLSLRLPLVLGAFVLIGLCALPASAAENAFVRVVHASPAAGNVDVFVDGNRLLNNFAFGTATGYVPLPAGSHRIQVAPAGKGIAGSVINQLVSVQAGLPYTVAAVGTSPMTLGLQPFVDNNLSAGKNAKVRVYHLSPNAGPVNVALGGKNVVNTLAYRNATSYLSVPPGSYNFNVTATQANATVPVTATLQAGTINSVFAVGLYKGNPGLKFVVATVPGVPGAPNTGSDPDVTPVQSSNALPWFIGGTVALLLLIGLAANRYVIRRPR